MANTKIPFLITIDTEGDNLWTISKTVTTQNARYLPRFQGLCEGYGFKPTWLTNFEMAECPAFREFGRDVLQRGQGEIGMHLHAWNSPPLTNDSLTGQAYLIEYPEKVMKDKIGFMSDLLEHRFERKMVSHRAGRWAFDSRYARLLVEHGYRVDCSVTPHVNWAGVLGDPMGLGGSDYTTYPAQAYFMDLERIDREGDSPLLEVPVSIVLKTDVAPITSWLRPNGQNRESMLEILKLACDNQWPCVEFMLHSSELMPGGSPTFQTLDDIEALYDDLELLLSKAVENFRGQTLTEFYNECERRHRPLIIS